VPLSIRIRKTMPKIPFYPFNTSFFNKMFLLHFKELTVSRIVPFTFTSYSVILLGSPKDIHFGFFLRIYRYVIETAIPLDYENACPRLGVVSLLFLTLYKVKSKVKTFLPLLFLKTIENNKKVTPDTKKLLKIDISKK
jgi:hypothetical protein